MNKQYYIYILTNKSNNVFYIGVTNNIIRRMFEHKQRLVDGFTKKYNVTKLVYFEIAYDVRSAITREKQLKNWHKQWKINLVTKTNPKWKDLNENIMPEQTLKQVQGDLRGHSELVSESVLPKKQTLKQVQGDKVD